MPDTHCGQGTSTVKGIRLAAASSGIRYQGRDDLVLMEICEGASFAAVFTQNYFKAAPVVIAQQNMHAASPRYLLINSGCANAGLGEAGMDAARQCCAELADLAAVSQQQVLPFSTGVIGEALPIDKVIKYLPQLHRDLKDDGWLAAANAIMTTDTAAKCESCCVELSDGEFVITGIAKGSGMIHPDMATMLAFIATDIAIDQQTLTRLLRAACDDSFHSITVDGDTSSNDACVLIATGQSGIVYDDLDDTQQHQVCMALGQLMQELAKAIARDGEGASRLIEIRVAQAASREEARMAARVIATSPLVKTACFAGDPNWGRIVAALGRCLIEHLDMSRVRCVIGGHCVFEHGAVAAGYDEKSAKQAMSKDEVAIEITLGRGDDDSTVWTCDLTGEYIKINAEYRS